MNVVVWKDSELPEIPRRHPSRRLVSPTLIGVVGTLLLHGLVIQSVPFGMSGRKAKLLDTQEYAAALSKTVSTESLELIALPTVVNSNQISVQTFVSSLPDLSKMKIKPEVQIDLPAFFNNELLALSEDQATRATTQPGDTAEQARLFGIYTGQIKARIARLWRRPRTPVNRGNAGTNLVESFQCEAQIVQDDGGNVQEVLLPRCNGSTAWRNSLVLAIQHASPLPVPPSETVFSASITLNFVGLSYFPGASDDDYETERRTLIGAR